MDKPLIETHLLNSKYHKIIGFDERRGRGDRGNANLDPKHELDVPANREFYKHNDVRPPYTYAALIRYVSLVFLCMKTFTLCIH